MKRLIFILLAAALFTACKKDNTQPTPTPVTSQALGSWRSISPYYQDPTITPTRLYWDSVYSDGDSILLTATLIIKEYPNGKLPDTAFRYWVSANNDTLWLINTHTPINPMPYIRKH